MSGSEMQREKEKVAQKMREKQAAGTSLEMCTSAIHLTELQRMPRRPLRALLARQSRPDYGIIPNIPTIFMMRVASFAKEFRLGYIGKSIRVLEALVKLFRLRGIAHFYFKCSEHSL